MHPLRSLALLAVASMLLAALPALAQTAYTWNGGAGDWDDAARWTPSGVPAAADTAVIATGAAALTANTTVAGFALSGPGVLTGDADFTVTSAMTWAGSSSGNTGIRGTGTVTVAPGATLRLTSTFQDYHTSSGRTLVNAGTATWEGAGRHWSGPGLFVNEGELDLAFGETDAFGFCFASTPDAITNGPAGLIRRTGTGEALLSCGFSNAGTVRVENGSLNLKGFNATGGTDTGAYEVEAAGTLVFSGSVRTMTASASITGDGAVEVRGGTTTLAGAYAVSSTLVAAGTFNLDGDATTDTLDMTSGTLGGSGTLTVTDAFTWTGGGLDGTGTAVVEPAATLAISGTTTKQISESRTLRLEGTGTWGAAVGSGGGDAYAFHNAGTLAMTDGAGATFVEIVNTGTLTKTGGGEVTFTNLRFSNDGVVRIEGGTLNVNGCCIANAAVTDTGTFTMEAGATLLFAGVRTFAPEAVVEGAGTVGFGSTTLTNQGTVKPGLSAGTLTVDGNYPAPQPDGVLEIELGGYTPGTEFDQLAVTGTAALGGTLRVVLVDGFAPAEGDRFLIVPADGGATGAFDALDLPGGLEAYVEASAAGAELVIGKIVANEPEADLPTAFALHAAYPNPFNPRATLRYDVPEAGRVTLALYDALGREVARLVDEVRAAGRHEVVLDAAGLASGLYLVRMTTSDGFAQTQRLTLAR